MSYNIDTFKLKRLERLVIPVDALYPANVDSSWHPNKPELIDSTYMIFKIQGGAEGFSMTGTIADGEMNVETFNNYGEGSGHFSYKILTPALKQSTGILEAVQVWEGGDSITRLLAMDGEVTDDAVEL